MIEEIRRVYREKPENFEWNLQSRADEHIYRRFVVEIHQELMKTRRALQACLSTLSYGKKCEVTEKQLCDLKFFFVGMQKATTDIVKGGFLLSQQSAATRPTANSVIQTTNDVMEEGKRLVMFCQEWGIPCFDPDFLRKILTTMGFEEFKKIAEQEHAEIPPSKKVGRPLKKRAG